MGTQISWLIPAALLFGVAVLWARRRAPRTDGKRAAVLVWGSWLVVTGLVFSLSQGIIHPYYNVALAPAIGALVGIGAAWAWATSSALLTRVATAAAVAGTAVWAYELLDRTPAWHPALRTAVLAAGVAAAFLALLPPPAPRACRRRRRGACRRRLARGARRVLAADRLGRPHGLDPDGRPGRRVRVRRPRPRRRLPGRPGPGLRRRASGRRARRSTGLRASGRRLRRRARRRPRRRPRRATRHEHARRGARDAPADGRLELHLGRGGASARTAPRASSSRHASR